VSSHRLKIESGRYGRGRVERHERTCHGDAYEFEDDYHFVLKCSAYENLRSQYIKRHFYNLKAIKYLQTYVIIERGKHQTK
jgi:hypothetical protein